MRKHILLAVAMVTIGLSACRESADDEQFSSDQLAAFESARSLDQKFNIYLAVYRSETPPNLSLAAPFASIGPEAYLVAQGHAQTGGNLIEIMASLEIIRRYNVNIHQSCSAADKRSIIVNARKHLRPENYATFDEIIRHSCRLPKGPAQDVIDRPAEEVR